MATWNPVPDGDVSVAGWTQEDAGAAPIFDAVDEGIAAADSTGIQGTAGDVEAQNTPWFSLSDSPADLADGSVTAVSIRLRHKQSGRVDDTMTWQAKLNTSTFSMNLAAASSGENNPTTNVGTDSP